MPPPTNVQVQITGGRPSFADIATREMLGFTYEPKTAGMLWKGWGSAWSLDKDVSTASNSVERVLNLRNVHRSGGSEGIAGKLISTLRAYSTFSSAYTGFKEEGLVGAGKWLGAEWIVSGISGSAVAAGTGLGGEALISLGGVGGMIMTGGSPLGYIGGTALTASVVQGGLAATAIGVGMPIALAAATTAGGAYIAGRGSYEVMKAGYQRRQRLLTKIDTAGATASFMNKNAFTMRSRAIEAIRNNHLSAKSAFGNEIRRVHFSSYRKLIGTSY